MECARSIRGRLSLLSSISLAVSDVWSCYIDNLPLNASCALHTPPKGETPPRVVLPPCAVCRAQFPHSYKLQSMPCALLAHLFIFIAVVTAMSTATLRSSTWPNMSTLRMRCRCQGSPNIKFRVPESQNRAHRTHSAYPWSSLSLL